MEWHFCGTSPCKYSGRIFPCSRSAFAFRFLWTCSASSSCLKNLWKELERLQKHYRESPLMTLFNKSHNPHDFTGRLTEWERHRLRRGSPGIVSRAGQIVCSVADSQPPQRCFFWAVLISANYQQTRAKQWNKKNDFFGIRREFS